MVGEVLLPLALMGVIVSLAVLQARGRKEAKLPMWRAVAAFARRHDLTVRECPSAPYGVPEAFGDIAGRPFHMRVVTGKASRPVQTAIAVGCRVPLREEVYVTRGGVSSWVLGSPRWRQAYLGSPPKERQVRLTSPHARTVARLQGRISSEGIERLRSLVEAEGFYALAFRFGKAELRAQFLVQDQEALERLTAGLLAATDAVESFVDPDAREPLTRIRPWRTWFARWTDTGIMLFLLGIAGFLALLPFSGGIPTWEAWAFLEGAALVLAAMAGSRLWASWLGPEERAILAEFANRP